MTVITAPPIRTMVLYTRTTVTVSMIVLVGTRAGDHNPTITVTDVGAGTDTLDADSLREMPFGILVDDMGTMMYRHRGIGIFVSMPKYRHRSWAVLKSGIPGMAWLHKDSW